MPLINFAGIASGIDSNALIDALSEATRTQRVKPAEKKISDLEETNTALTDLKDKLEALRLMILEFATLNGGALRKSAVSTDETVMTATASTAAINGTYTVNVLSKAKNQTHSFDDSFSGSSDTLFAAPDPVFDALGATDRDVVYTIGTGTNKKTIDVPITSTMTVGEYVTAFNNHAQNAGRATASVVQMGTGDYRIVVNTNFEGTAKGSIYVDPGPPPTTPAVDVAADIQGMGGIFLTQSTDPATDAQITVSGINGTITRSTNAITDVIAGVTLNVQDTSGSSTITVTDDVAASTAAVQDIIDQFNDIVTFVNENNLITREDDGENVESIFAPLSITRLDDNAITSIKGAISSSSFAGGSLVKIFADLGLSTQRDGTLKFDTDKFATAIANEATSVNQILMRFGDLAGTTQGLAVYQYTRANGLIESAVSSNKSLITNLNDRIARAEEQILKQEDTMRQRFSRLEGLIGQMQNQQAALTNALAGLGGR